MEQRIKELCRLLLIETDLTKIQDMATVLRLALRQHLDGELRILETQSDDSLSSYDPFNLDPNV